jgi:aminoglycoside 3-N-acetyltransferase
MPAKSPAIVTSVDLERGFERLGLRDVQIAVVHSSLSAFGWVDGGAPAVIDAPRDAVPTIVMPPLCTPASCRRRRA